MSLNLLNIRLSTTTRFLRVILVTAIICVGCIFLFYGYFSFHPNLKIGPASLEQKKLEHYVKGLQEDQSEYNKLKLFFENKKNPEKVILPVDKSPDIWAKDSPQRKFYDQQRIILTPGPIFDRAKEKDMYKVGDSVWIEGALEIAKPPKININYLETNTKTPPIVHHNTSTNSRDTNSNIQKPNTNSRSSVPVKHKPIARDASYEKKTDPPKQQLIKFKDRQLLVEKSYKDKSGVDINPKVSNNVIKGNLNVTNKIRSSLSKGIHSPCKDLFYQFKFQETRNYMLTMFDPGNCSLISDSHKKFFKVDDKEQNYLMSPGYHELYDFCQRRQFTLGKGRFCDGMPAFFKHGHIMQHYATSAEAQALAMDELGDRCYNSKLGMFITPGNIEHQGGPRKVINNLLSGLRLIGKVYYLNGRELENYDYKVLLDPIHRIFMYYLTFSDKPWNYYLGPTVAAYHFDAKRISNASRDHVHIVGASKQALDKTDQYFPGLPMDRGKAVIIPTGVDTFYFKPNISYPQRKPKVSLFYFKVGCNQYLMGLLREEVVRRGFAIVEIKYGGYTETDFRNILQNIKFAILCDGYETQGLAVEEIMSMDVPIFATEPDSVPYFSNKVGMVYSQNIPLPEQFDEFFNRVHLGEYSPRKWVQENFGLVPSAVNFMRVLCKQKNPWNRF